MWHRLPACVLLTTGWKPMPHRSRRRMRGLPGVCKSTRASKNWVPPPAGPSTPPPSPSEPTTEAQSHRDSAARSGPARTQSVGSPEGRPQEKRVAPIGECDRLHACRPQLPSALQGHAQSCQLSQAANSAPGPFSACGPFPHASTRKGPSADPQGRKVGGTFRRLRVAPSAGSAPSAGPKKTAWHLPHALPPHLRRHQNQPRSQRGTESQSHRVTESQSHRVTESQSHRVTESQSHRGSAARTGITPTQSAGSPQAPRQEKWVSPSGENRSTIYPNRQFGS